MRVVAAGIRLIAWGLVAALGLLAAVRVVAWDASSPILLGIHGLGPFPYLAAFPVAAVALARRHVRLGLVALAVAAAALPTGLPEAMARTGLPPGTRAATHLRVLSWNLYEANPATALDRVVRQADADIVVLQEVSGTNLPAIQASSALAAYPYLFTSPQPTAFGSGIWSRLPLEGSAEFDVGGLPMTRTVVRTAAGPVRLVNVHTLSPVTRDGLTLWPRQLRALGQEAERSGPPIMLVGDFNATWGHRPFRRLLASGLADAAATRGRSWSPTWPDMGWPGGRAFLRLDHLLTGPGLVATSYATGGGAGSDHRSILVDVAVEPVPPV